MSKALRDRLLTAALAVSLALPVASVTLVTTAAAAGCSATNTRTGTTVTSLKTAIKTAKAGDTLKVKGTCTGAFAIGKNLKLIGSGTAPTLKGGASGTVVTVAAGKTVSISKLTITGGKGLPCTEWIDFMCGGGVVNKGKLTLDLVTVRDNDLAQVTDLGGFGAGIYNQFSGRMTIKRSTIRDNSAISPNDWAQGAGITNEGVMLISGSTISGNTTVGALVSQGAGIFNGGTVTNTGHDAVGSLTIENSTISGNDASATGTALVGGGGIFSEPVAQTLVLQYVTITDNSASDGGGVHSEGPLHLIGALIAGNFAASTTPDCLAGDVLDATDTLLGANDGCGIAVGGDTGNQAGSVGGLLDPKLGALLKNGGPTRTHALLTGSPAIDAAGDAPCYLFKDQRGVTRPKGTACDIGAVEKG